MNCKNCNAELKEGVLFCQECGAKVEEEATENVSKCRQCGAELESGIKFCSQCGAAITDEQTENTTDDSVEMKDAVEKNVYTEKTNPFAMKVKAKLKEKPKFFGAIGIIALVLVVASSIGIGVSGNRSKPAETSGAGISSSASKSGSSSKAGSSSKSSSSSSGALTENLKEAMVASALMSEVRTKFPIADAGSTKYKINKTEQKSGYTIVYGKLYLYDKYGKSTTGRSDGSGSSIRTFEVKISNSTKKVSSCTIK